MTDLSWIVVVHRYIFLRIKDLCVCVYLIVAHSCVGIKYEHFLKSIMCISKHISQVSVGDQPAEKSVKEKKINK